MLRVALILLVFAPGAVAEARPVEAEGIVREVSGGPAGRSALELKTDDGKTLALRHKDAEGENELRRLGGVKIRVQGSDDANASGLVWVEKLEILDVGGGVVPRVGILAALELEGQKRLLFVDEQGNADLLPLGWVSKMSKDVGAKMWMVGKRKGNSFQPMRHSILRPGPKAAGAEDRGPKPTE